MLNEFYFSRVSLHGNVNSALNKLHKQVISFTAKTTPSHSELEGIVSQMTLADLNRALYRCKEEESDETKGASGAYDIPGFDPVVYCGLQGTNLRYYESVWCYYKI
jgi:glycogen debranching enzyme